MKPGAATPSEISRTCSECGNGVKVTPNPKYHRERREQAQIRLTEMSRILSLHHRVSVQFLSDIELGKKAFPSWIAEMYDRLFLRYTRSGDES